MILLDVDLGLFIGIILSILLIVIKDQNYEIRKLVKYNQLSEFVYEDYFKVFKERNFFFFLLFNLKFFFFFLNEE